MKNLLRLLGLLVASACLANMIRVPEDYQDLGTAINFSTSGDTISLFPQNHYIYQIINLSHNVTLIGRIVDDGGNQILPTINCNGSYNGFVFTIPQTIMYLNINNVRFSRTGNNSYQGLILANCNLLTINNCAFEGFPIPLISNTPNLIMRNAVISGISGIQLEFSVSTSATITNCTFYGTPRLYIGGVSCDLNISHCIFNSMYGHSYAIGIFGNGVVENCVYTNCGAPDYEPYQTVYFDGVIDVNNCIFWNNSFLSSQCIIGGYGNVHLSYNCIQGGSQYLCSSQVGDLNYDVGNILQNPQFISNSDFHLNLSSPCIDAGDPNSPLDPDGTRADMGAYYYCQGEGIHLPDILRVSTEPGYSEALTAILQSTCDPVVIDSARTGTGLFTLTSFPSQVAADYSSGAFHLSFNPTQQGIYSDTLHIWANTSPPHHSVPLVGEAGPIPAPVTDLAIAILPDLSALLTWSPVTETIYGNPVVPDYYLIFYNEQDPLDETDWYYQGAVADPPYMHFLAARFATLMNYRVVAWKGIDPARLGWQAGMRAADLRRLDSTRVH